MAGFGCCTDKNKLGDDLSFGTQPHQYLDEIISAMGILQEVDLGALGRGGREGGNLGAGGDNEAAQEKGKDCYELFFARVPVDWIPIKGQGGRPVAKGGKGVKSWSVGKPSPLLNLIGMMTGKAVGGHLVKICVCLGWAEFQGLAIALRQLNINIGGGGGKWRDNIGDMIPVGQKGPANELATYTLASAKVPCKDYRGPFFWKTKHCGRGTKCLCEDFTSLTLKGITEKTKEYTCSDGSKITVGPSTDFEKVIEKIVKAERKCLDIDCTNFDPAAILIPRRNIN